jgi:hypothetical protein
VITVTLLPTSLIGMGSRVAVTVSGISRTPAEGDS